MRFGERRGSQRSCNRWAMTSTSRIAPCGNGEAQVHGVVDREPTRGEAPHYLEEVRGDEEARAFVRVVEWMPLRDAAHKHRRLVERTRMWVEPAECLEGGPNDLLNQSWFALADLPVPAELGYQDRVEMVGNGLDEADLGQRRVMVGPREIERVGRNELDGVQQVDESRPTLVFLYARQRSASLLRMARTSSLVVNSS